MFFDDGVRRIDYVLVYPSKYKDPSHQEEHEKRRSVFEKNLVEEGLCLEHDIVVGSLYLILSVHPPND